MVAKVAVVVRAPAVQRLHRLANGRQQTFALERADPSVSVRIEWRRVSKVIAVIRAVGRVQIHDDVGIPARQQRDQRSRFCRLELDEVAIQIEAVRVLTRADTTDGTVLLGPVVETDAFVAVGVVDRSKQPDRRFQKPLQISSGHATSQVQHGLLALDLSGVDVGHHEDHRERVR
jgi:hypothetical protein